MLDQRLIIVVNRNWRIIKCCHYVFLHIANLCSLVLHTVHYKLDMAAIQLHESTFHYINRLFIPGYSDKLLIAAQHIQDYVKNLIYLFYSIGVALYPVTGINIVCITPSHLLCS